MGFTVKVLDRGNGYLIPPPQLAVTAKRWSDHAEGGAEQATIEVAGPVDLLHVPLQWLGFTVHICNEYGDEVWWGYIDEVEVSFGAFVVRMALRDLYNRVKVLYAFQDAGGANATGETTWAEDADSVSRYGRKALLASMADAKLADAEARRALILSQAAVPSPQVQGSGEGVGAVVHCRGFWDWLSWQYYESNEGLETYAEVGEAWQELDASYTATTISFEPGDNIFDTANGFSFLDEGDRFTVAGSALNDGVFGVDSGSDDGHLNTDGAQLLEAAGPSVTISVGSRGRITKVGQSFQLGGDGGWLLKNVSLRMQKVGSPADNVVVKLRSDSGGDPGTVLDTATVAASDVTASMGWVTINFAGGTVALATGTTYWLVVERSGAASAINHVRVELSEAAGYSRGSVKLLNGATLVWSARSPAADMPFRLEGAVDAAERIEDIILANSLFAGVEVRSTAGLERWPYRDGVNTGLAYVRELLAPGTAAGSRLVTVATKDRVVTIDVAPSSGAGNLVLGLDGRLRPALGGQLAPGRTVAGTWVDLELPSTAAEAVAGLSPVFVQRSEYDAGAGRVAIETMGSQSVWEGVQPG